MKKNNILSLKFKIPSKKTTNDFGLKSNKNTESENLIPCQICGNHFEYETITSHELDCLEISQKSNKNNNYNTKYCEKCKKLIPEGSFDIHSTQCRKNSSIMRPINENIFNDDKETNNAYNFPINYNIHSNFYDTYTKIKGQAQNKNDENKEEINIKFHIDDNRENLNGYDDIRLCHICEKYLENKIAYEMHMRICQENQNNINNNPIVDPNSSNSHIEFDDSNNDDFQIDNHNAHINGQNIDVNNLSLVYEELSLLDEKITHPLNQIYVSMLPDEKMTNSILSKLADDSKKCSICFEEFKLRQKFIRLPCFHLFHAKDILKWFKDNKTCPVCREDIENLLKKYK